MKRIRTLAAVAALATLISPAGAVTTQTTQFSYFPVSGNSPAEIYRAILRSGPRVDGSKALAATTANGVQNSMLTQDGTSCQVTSFRVQFRFVVNLPHLINAYGLSNEDRRLWGQFSEFLKRHELQHTRLWLRCAADLELKVMAIKASTCAAVTATSDKLWKQMQANCNRKQTDFDTEQRAELLRQPFMRRVMGQ